MLDCCKYKLILEEIISYSDTSTCSEIGKTKMPVQFKKTRITIPLGAGPRSIRGSVRFESKVISSELVLAGFNFDFSQGSPRNPRGELDQIEINFERVGVHPPDVNAVYFLLECRYQDSSATDIWKGHVELVVVADVE